MSSNSERKAIQCSITATDQLAQIAVVCVDGSVWTFNRIEGWVKLPPILTLRERIDDGK